MQPVMASQGLDRIGVVDGADMNLVAREIVEVCAQRSDRGKDDWGGKEEVPPPGFNRE